jgi:hypothetical protein
MTDELSIQVAKLSPRPGDVLVFRYPANISEEAKMHIWQSAQGCQNYFGCKCITLPQSLSLESADEAAMIAAGWHRQGSPLERV